MLENPLIVLVDTYEINHYLGFMSLTTDFLWN